jgi:hypothetical protein
LIARQTIGSARAETLRRSRFIVAGAFALAAMLLPNAALGMDSAPQQTAARAADLLPLPPIRYLDSMRWMDWQPSVPALKVDTLLLPDGTRPGKFRFPPNDEYDLAHLS